MSEQPISVAPIPGTIKLTTYGPPIKRVTACPDGSYDGPMWPWLTGSTKRRTDDRAA